jgi:hypothetical protein
MRNHQSHYPLATHDLEATLVVAVLSTLAVFAAAAAVAAPTTAATALLTVAVMSGGRRLRALVGGSVTVRPRTTAE